MSIPAIFRDWYMAEAGAQYATPCPVEVMEHLIAMADEVQQDRLSAQPAADHHELLLKIYPLLLATFEPSVRDGQHPLAINPESNANGNPALLKSVIDDLTRLCPEIAEAVSLEWPGKRRAA